MPVDHTLPQTFWDDLPTFGSSRYGLPPNAIVVSVDEVLDGSKDLLVTYYDSTRDSDPELDNGCGSKRITQEFLLAQTEQ